MEYGVCKEYILGVLSKNIFYLVQDGYILWLAGLDLQPFSSGVVEAWSIPAGRVQVLRDVLSGQPWCPQPKMPRWGFPRTRALHDPYEQVFQRHSKLGKLGAYALCMKLSPPVPVYPSLSSPLDRNPRRPHEPESREIACMVIKGSAATQLSHPRCLATLLACRSTSH